MGSHRSWPHISGGIRYNDLSKFAGKSPVCLDLQLAAEAMNLNIGRMKNAPGQVSDPTVNSFADASVELGGGRASADKLMRQKSQEVAILSGSGSILFG